MGGEVRETYFVFVIQAYEGETPQMTLMDVCTIELISVDAETALATAKQIMPKKFYRVQRVIEQFVDKK